MTASIRKKADKNKNRARFSTIASITASSAIPIVIAFTGGNVPLRIIASILAAAVVIIGTWTQIEKPHERWALYRRYQRLLEAEQLRYQFRGSDYADRHTRERALAEYLARAQVNLHEEWEGLIPKSVEVHDTTREVLRPA